MNDVDGERPLIYHEVIDHGTEPITMDEYTYIGKVTEFNVGSWISCIKNNGFECYNGYPGVSNWAKNVCTFPDEWSRQFCVRNMSENCQKNWQLLSFLQLTFFDSFGHISNTFPKQGAPIWESTKVSF